MLILLFEKKIQMGTYLVCPEAWQGACSIERHSLISCFKVLCGFCFPQIYEIYGKCFAFFHRQLLSFSSESCRPINVKFGRQRIGGNLGVLFLTLPIYFLDLH